MAEEIYKDVFNQYDKDNSGFIDRAELRAMMQ